MARVQLFDLAVNRALSYALRSSLLNPEIDAKTLHSRLELWYLRTRFAYRISLDDVVSILQSYPHGDEVDAEFYWQGGKTGGWQCGRNPHP